MIQGSKTTNTIQFKYQKNKTRCYEIDSNYDSCNYTFLNYFLLVMVGIGAKSGSFIFQSANAQVTIFPGRRSRTTDHWYNTGQAGGIAESWI